MKFIEKHWLLLALGILIIVLLGERQCRPDDDKEVLKASNERITELEKDNLKKEEAINKAVKDAKMYEEKVAEVEAELIESESIIEYLRKKRATVVEEVIALPPSMVVEQTRQILNCAQIEMTDEGVLFSTKCTQTNLTKLKQFSLIKEELDKTQFALTKSKKATQLQKQYTWTVYQIASGLISQRTSYRKIIKEKDYQFSLCQKKKKGAWWDGLWKGFVIGVIVTATVKLIFGKLI